MDPYEYQFENLSRNSLHWHNKASDLFTSARVLWEAMDNGHAIECWSTYKMLMGLSFELLFKAIAMQRKLAFSATHQLVEIANSAHIRLTTDEKEILRVLTEYILWGGKYPVPHKKTHLENHWKHENKVAYDKEKHGSLTIERGNNKLDLDELAKIWIKYSDIYMIEHTKR
ncbi:hypothetical protein [Psychrobacter sp. Pi2-52]|uniref:hypothetical protein n=1 Tax=Psychrobacter sp. Pi2-52 TaxID=2774133 RepID=UPI001918612B|nr:hypothetical protein [Psychrobacter sp. Pi2-52]